MDQREMHDDQWPWCPYGNHFHQHSEALGEGSRVNGRPAGPMWQLQDRVVLEADAR